MSDHYKDFGWTTAEEAHCGGYVFPAVESFLPPPGSRVLDVGCGNGALAGRLISMGYLVVGLDLSEQGIEVARKAYPGGRFEILAADESVLQKLNVEPFDAVVSTEVVEHLYDPRSYARGCFAALKSGGVFICSTPYHGYAKNLVLAMMNRWDTHANPLWDGGHIKLWSRATLTSLLLETGFVDIQFKGLGRFPYLWKSMVVTGRKP